MVSRFYLNDSVRNSNPYRRRRYGGTPTRSRPVAPSRLNYESHGPNGSKIRGVPNQIAERYVHFAREVASSDRILMEAYLQYAENYLRLARGDYDVSGGGVFKIRRFDERIDNPDGISERDRSNEDGESETSEPMQSAADERPVRRRPQVKRTGTSANKSDDPELSDQPSS